MGRLIIMKNTHNEKKAIETTYDAQTKPSIYFIGNAHLDPVWLWKWQEGYRENINTMNSMLDRLEEHKDIVFTSSSSTFYEWIEEHDLAALEHIRKRVHEGRWELCGGWPIQPDCNLPSGEAFARHSLIGQHTFKRIFGKIATIGWCVDSFGHNGSLPQILRLSRMNRYVFMRPSEKEKKIGADAFEWISPDGSSVLAYRIPYSYCAFDGLERIIDSLVSQLIQQKQQTQNSIACFYGVGNHGGGPTNDNIELIRKKQEQYPNIIFKFSTMDSYFSVIEHTTKTLPKIFGDLHHHASGCYAAHSGIKKWNRKAENGLLRAEKISSLATVLVGSKYRNTELENAWKLVLFNQFHDILAGTSIREAYEDAKNQLGEAQSIASRIENWALQKIASSVKISAKKNALPIFVCNPHPWHQIAPVEFEWGKFLNTLLPEEFEIVDPDGNLVIHQLISPKVEERNRTRIIFSAPMEPFGYKVFLLQEKKHDKNSDLHLNANTISNDLFQLDNGILQITFDSVTGAISKLFEYESKAQYLLNLGSLGMVFEDTPDTWGHDTLSYISFIGSCSLVSIEKVEHGPVRQTIRVVSRWNKSTLIQNFSLHHSEAFIRVEAYVNWQEEFKGLKLQFPVNVSKPTATYSIPFGSIKKNVLGEEEPMQEWIDVSGDSGKGLTIINDCKYSASVKEGEIGITIVRNPTYSHHKPTKPSLADNYYRYIDQGEQDFKYIIKPHSKPMNEPEIARLAIEFNQDVVVIIDSFHGGFLPMKKSVFNYLSSSSVVTCIKQRYDANGFIIRMYETAGIKDIVSFSDQKNKEVQITLQPHQIKTLHLDDSLEYVKEVDFLEWELEPYESEGVNNT